MLFVLIVLYIAPLQQRGTGSVEACGAEAVNVCGSHIGLLLASKLFNGARNQVAVAICTRRAEASAPTGIQLCVELNSRKIPEKRRPLGVSSHNSPGAPL